MRSKHWVTLYLIYLNSYFSTSVIGEHNMSVEDGSTPKAVIRDKFRRVSLALSSSEMELEHERLVRLEVETELQELQEFTR